MGDTSQLVFFCGSVDPWASASVPGAGAVPRVGAEPFSALGATSTSESASTSTASEGVAVVGPLGTAESTKVPYPVARMALLRLCWASLVACCVPVGATICALVEVLGTAEPSAAPAKTSLAVGGLVDRKGGAGLFVGCVNVGDSDNLIEGQFCSARHQTVLILKLNLVFSQSLQHQMLDVGFFVLVRPSSFSPQLKNFCFDIKWGLVWALLVVPQFSPGSCFEFGSEEIFF